MNQIHERVYVALGANLGNRESTFAWAIETMDKDPDLEVLRVSSILETAPIGPPGQNAYLNAVVELRVSLEPRALLARLHAIEAAVGRDRAGETQRWGPRVLDLDIVFFGDRRLDSPELVIPHPRAHERNFVMTPLSQLAPDLIHPILGTRVVEISRALPPLSARGH